MLDEEDCTITNLGDYAMEKKGQYFLQIQLFQTLMENLLAEYTVHMWILAQA